jgi:hypothetical protein
MEAKQHIFQLTICIIRVFFDTTVPFIVLCLFVCLFVFCFTVLKTCPTFLVHFYVTSYFMILAMFYLISHNIIKVRIFPGIIFIICNQAVRQRLFT